MADGTYMKGVMHPNIGDPKPNQPFDGHTKTDLSAHMPDGDDAHTCESPTGMCK